MMDCLPIFPIIRKNIFQALSVPRNVIADSSALVALLRQDDQHHRWLDAHIANLPTPWLTCEPGLTEAFHLVGTKGASQLKDLLRRRAMVLSFDLGDELK